MTVIIFCVCCRV